MCREETIGSKVARFYEAEVFTKYYKAKVSGINQR